jgi:hypothetical protein
MLIIPLFLPATVGVSSQKEIMVSPALVKWESFEFYHTDPETEPNITKWETLIAFPL